MLNDSYWREYNDGKSAFLHSVDGEIIAYVQYKHDSWICTIQPTLIAEEFRWCGIDSIKTVEWQTTNYIYNKCNDIANQLHKIRDHLPSIHVLAEKARNDK